MRKTILALTALAAIGFAVPYAAPAKADSAAKADRADVGHRHHHHTLLNQVLPSDHHDRDHKTVIIKHEND
jgi:hypothetical protein